ncbi:MAG: cytochrome-c peroxidase, partial [Verrucomicrobiota bacterium]
AYQRQLISSDSPFDRFVGRLRRGERHLLTPEFNQQHLRGLVIFTGKGQCTLCHAGPTLTDHEFHNIGLDRGGSELDRGRYPAVEQVKNDPFNGQGLFSDDPSLEANQALHYVTTRDSNLGEFKTPTLRNVARTAPYMHDGRFETLEEVVTFYSTLPDEPALGHREESLQPLGLRGDEVKDLVAFLETLTGAPLDPALMRAPGVRP